MNPPLTDILCTRCGLCCDGSLFADVELASPREAVRLEILGLEIEEEDGSGGLLVQPCRALKGKRCSVYLQRPNCCRTFECHLLQSVRRGRISLGEAEKTIAEVQRRIQQVKDLLVQLGPENEHLTLQERCAEALLSERGDENPAVKQWQDDLEATQSAAEEMIQRAFLNYPKTP